MGAAGALALAGSLLPAAADNLSDAYRLVLSNPADSDVNLQYALVAEGNRKWRLALAAYERILANDPHNAAALRGLQRVRRIIQPPSTLWRTEVGTSYVTNPLESATGADPEFFAYGSIRVTDERNLFNQRWRSTVRLYGEGHFEQSDLSNILASADTGPIIDLPGTLFDIHPAVGVAASYFEGRYAYSEVNVASTIEGYLDGTTQWARIRGGYRQYNPFFTSDAGFYAGLDGRLVRKGFTDDRDLVSVAPWFLWSDINGYVLNATSNQITPGRYMAGGARFEYDLVVAPRVTIGPFVQVSDWRFGDLAPDGSHRHDLLVSPGVSLLFSDIFKLAQTDLRIDYRYDHNDSNDPTHDYTNQQVTIAIVTRR